MSLILENGVYRYKAGTKRLDSSDASIYRAGIEMSLSKGSWGYFPNSGHELVKYKQEKRTDEMVLAAKKEIKFYLRSYIPEVKEKAANRFAEEYSVSVE